ncbi:uncharacterized protein KD926_003000 [Aspergillus affinis]|uniref:uncharacterized protein n=1 Tax=Aspergillus affinis TaxID=1070780 RepID=UPI0022FDD14D|nr:uncharacterized protein KD926_003000 [Aspergillus affinis]KAI9043650.1 hypothetical protein KD926_003000 [Aspergillus affinis]
MTVKRSFISKDRVEKSIRSAKKVFSGHGRVRAKKMQERTDSPPTDSPLLSPIVSLIVGPDQRLFVAHEDVLCRSPFFAAMLRDQFVENAMDMAIALPEEEPEILSCVLEFLYKGDYFPRLFRNKDTNTWDLENAHLDGYGSSEATIFLSGLPGLVLRDTAVYCAAEKYGLEGLKRLALRKQGHQSGIPIDVILRSARYAYDNTPDSEYRLRAHYLAMIIRTRHIFKSSGTMQVEMELGHPFFFDLFVAMCNHMDDLEMKSGILPSIVLFRPDSWKYLLTLDLIQHQLIAQYDLDDDMQYIQTPKNQIENTPDFRLHRLALLFALTQNTKNHQIKIRKRKTKPKSNYAIPFSRPADLSNEAIGTIAILIPAISDLFTVSCDAMR